jgi:membrane dipeptidase
LPEAGNSLHIGGLRSDGAFGKEQCPHDIETIYNLQFRLLSKRGYSEKDVENIMHGNWLRFLRNATSKL